MSISGPNPSGPRFPAPGPSRPGPTGSTSSVPMHPQQRDGARRWKIVREFYRAYRTFHAIYDQYERRVAGLETHYGKPRADLHVAPDELLSLFDSQALAQLAADGLETLKEVAQTVFRTLDQPDPFVSDLTAIYHEISLLKEQHWTIREDVMRRDRTAYEYYYREVNESYPERLRHVRDRFDRARARLENTLLEQFGTRKVVIRSVYLFGDALVRGLYPGGVEELYGYLYPGGGALTGYSMAADSLCESGFVAEALEAYDRAIEHLDGLGSADVAETERREAQRRSLLRRREKCVEQLEA